MFCSIFVAAAMGCSTSFYKEQQANASLKSENLNSILCDSVLNLLVYSSDLSSDLKGKTVTQDGLEDDSLLIKISHDNEVDPGAVVDAADGFLTIDIKNKKLYQNVIETNSLKEVKCDMDILDRYIHHCIK